MNKQHKFGYAPLPKPQPIQGATNQPKAVSEYETCENAVTSRKDQSYNGIPGSINTGKGGGTKGGSKADDSMGEY